MYFRDTIILNELFGLSSSIEKIAKRYAKYGVTEDTIREYQKLATGLHDDIVATLYKTKEYKIDNKIVIDSNFFNRNPVKGFFFSADDKKMYDDKDKDFYYNSDRKDFKKYVREFEIKSLKIADRVAIKYGFSRTSLPSESSELYKSDKFPYMYMNVSFDYDKDNFCSVGFEISFVGHPRD